MNCGPPRKGVNLRKSASVQVDYTSGIIKQLNQEKESLLDRLTEPKKRKSVGRKPMHALHRTASISRVHQLVTVYQGSNKQLPTFEEFECSFRKVRQQLGITSPAKPNKPSPMLSAMEDLQLFSGIMTYNQRRLLKTKLRLIDRDFLASNHEVEDLAKKFGSELDIGAIYSQGKPILWIKNAKKVIESRLLRLHQSKQLQLDGKYGEKIFLFLVDDKGGSSTKIAVGIANVSSINSYEHLLMVALFQGDDNYENLVR
uniref:Uncharacterized protein n=1 Tax=Ditylenchus dipsaci TaxID=166011 RepID=A0A915E8V6_9BILA